MRNFLTFLLFFSLFSFIAVDFYYVINRDIERQKEHESHIGEMVVIDGDSLTIVNWKSGGFGHEQGYQLSNGVVISEKIVTNDK